MNDTYLQTVRLLLAIAPDVFAAPSFAMKGGTAINLFLQNLPRLSVDIDVVFTDHTKTREEALAEISKELSRAKDAIERQGYTVQFSKTPDTAKQKGDEVKLTAFSESSACKVEVNYVFRGTLLPPEMRLLAPAAQDLFETGISIPTLHEAELYGSKLVAAMDRQHPRDIFDVMQMYQMYGLRPDFVDAFVGYLAGHNRPPHEVLFGRRKTLEGVYERDFVGMTVEHVELDELIETQARIFQELPAVLTDKQKQFLMSLVRTEPEWDLMPYPHMKDLPAIRWKILNLEKLKARDAGRFADQERLLRERFAKA